MFRNIARLAYHLDEWLQTKLGRRYNSFLGVGLVLGVMHQMQDLPKDFAKGGGITTILVALMDIALLINQAGQFHQHLERRDTMPRQKPLLRRGRAAKAVGEQAPALPPASSGQLEAEPED